MNTSNSDDDRNSLHDAYRKVRYPGRLADDVAKELALRTRDEDGSAEQMRRRDRKRWIPVALATIVASAAIFALCFFPLPRQPSVDANNSSVAESGTVKRTTERDDAVRAPGRSPTVSSTDVAVHSGDRAEASAAEAINRGRESHAFLVFGEHSDDRVSTRRSGKLTSLFRTSQRHTKVELSQRPFSIFPASTFGNGLDKKPQPKLGAVRQRKFNLFPSQLRSSKST